MAINRNVCKTFSHTQTDALRQLADQECSEVIVLATKETTYYDHRNPTVGFIVPKDTVFTFRGLTNSNQLSARGAAGSNDVICYRTQFFSYSPGH